MKSKDNKLFPEAMRQNPDNWKGIFYVNRHDYRILVPKMEPRLGWTLNFGNIYAWLGLAAIILIIIAAEYLL